jgi:hypothetical protein
MPTASADSSFSPWLITVSEPGLRRSRSRSGFSLSERERRSLALDFEEAVRTVRSAGLSVFGGMRRPPSRRSPASFLATSPTRRAGGGQPFRLEAWQRRFVDELYRTDERGIDGVIRHDGDPVTVEQLAWTRVDRLDNGDIRRLGKLERLRPIHVSVVFALAVWRDRRVSDSPRAGGRLFHHGRGKPLAVCAGHRRKAN